MFHPSREDGVEKYKRPKIKPRVFLSERGELRIMFWKPKRAFKEMKYLAFQEKQESQREGYCAFDQVGLHTPGFAKPEIDKV